MDYSAKEILRSHVQPALGCTEPVAIALGTAAAASLLPGAEPESIEVWVDANIYKNGMSVLIPGTGGLHGLDLAAALGALGGDPSRRLEVLDTIDENQVRQAQQMLDQGRVVVRLIQERGLQIRTRIRTAGEEVESLITGTHDNIVSLHRNGSPVLESALLGGPEGDSGNRLAELEAWLAKRSIAELLALLDGLDEEDLQFLEEGVRFNDRLARHGLKYGTGLGVGKCFSRLIRQRLMCRDMVSAARMLTSAAADARMGGVKLPAMSSAGSGNHGLTAVLPIWAVRDFIDHSLEDVLKAVALSHIVTAYVKAHTGRLSAICGCSVAAGAGATAGIAFLLGGDARHISHAINNLILDLAGVICDGAKLGCALKLATAAGTAVQSALFSMQGVHVLPTDGIVDRTFERTTFNLGLLSSEGMAQADQTILQILMAKVAESAADGRDKKPS